MGILIILAAKARTMQIFQHNAYLLPDSQSNKFSCVYIHVLHPYLPPPPPLMLLLLLFHSGIQNQVCVCHFLLYFKGAVLLTKRNTISVQFMFANIQFNLKGLKMKEPCCLPCSQEEMMKIFFFAKPRQNAVISGILA